MISRQSAPITLGITAFFPYVQPVTGFLRFVGIMNAAVWFGASIFFTFGIGPGVFSGEMQSALQLKPELPFNYFAGSIAQVLIARYFHLQLVCGVIALLHLLAERLYLGKTPESMSLGLLTALLSISLLGAFWLQPKLKNLHTIRYKVTTPPDAREAARESFRVWHGVSQAINLLMISGLGFYLWRVANPPDSTRFLIPGKFRG